MPVCGELQPRKTTKHQVFPRVATLGATPGVVNSFQQSISSIPSRTCATLERLVQALSTTSCFVSNFEIESSEPKSVIGRAPEHTATTGPFASAPRMIAVTQIAGMTLALSTCGGTRDRARGRIGQPLASTRLPQPPLAKGAPRQRRGIGSTAGGPKFAAQALGLWFEARLRTKAAEPADKPGSVVDSHSSRRSVTATLEQPTRTRRGPRHEVPIWSCSRWGLPCRPVARLAVRSYRTISPLPDPMHPKVTGHRRYLSVALSVGSRRPGVTWHRALWSPDFPRHPPRRNRMDDATAWPTPPPPLSHAAPSAGAASPD